MSHLSVCRVRFLEYVPLRCLQSQGFQYAFACARFSLTDSVDVALVPQLRNVHGSFVDNNNVDGVLPTHNMPSAT
jgi:hypothetical protein